MPKKKDKNGEEFWRGKCRELEKQVRQLQKVLSYYEKREHTYEDRSQDEEIIKDNEDTAPALFVKECESCGKSKMVETLNLMNKIYGECKLCGFKGRMK